MAAALEKLGQARPANTTPVTIFSPSTNEGGTIEILVVANSSGAQAKFRLFYDEDGSTFAEATTLGWDLPLAANSQYTWAPPKGIYLKDASANFGIRTDTANALTFTAFGTKGK